MRRDELYLRDIAEAADSVGRFLTAVSQDEFLANELLQSAVLQKLILIGEAAAKLSAEFKDRHPEVGWRDVVALRNIAVHAYFSVRWSLVWATATEDVPELKQQVARMLQADFPDTLPQAGQ